MPPPTSSVGRCLWIKASPRGTRSGFAVLPDGNGGQLTVTVLPKAWASTPAVVVREFTHIPGETTHVVVHETEQFAVRTMSAAAGALALSLTDLSRDQANLLDLAGQPNNVSADATIPGDPFGDLINLMLLAERGQLTSSKLSFEGSFAPTLLRLLTQERFLRLVESLIFRARPRYAQRTESLEMPRGRLREKSLLFSLATGTPRVESTFDELTMDTALLQVVASALRVVASDPYPRRVSALHPSLRTRAVHLLRHFSGVRLVDRERAVMTAERLWLGPLDRFWQPALDAAVPVLRNRAVVPESGGEMTEAYLVHVATEKFWEQCLQLALESTFQRVSVSRDGNPGEDVLVTAPWSVRPTLDNEASASQSASFPDFMFRSRQWTVVADAKYRLGGVAPNSQDGYQLFAYSHLATLRGQPADVAVLLYPLAGGQARQRELERLPDRSHSLWLCTLPFPTRHDLQSHWAWSMYVALLATSLRDLSVDWVGRRPPSLAPNR